MANDKKQENPWKTEGSLASQVHHDITHAFDLPWPRKPMRVGGPAGKSHGKAQSRPATRSSRSHARPSKKNPFGSKW